VLDGLVLGMMSELVKAGEKVKGIVRKIPQILRAGLEGLIYPDRDLNERMLLELMPELYFKNTFPRDNGVEELLNTIDDSSGLSYRVLLARFLENELPFDEYACSKSRRIHIQSRHYGRNAPFCVATFDPSLSVSKIQIEVNVDHPAPNFKRKKAEVDVLAAMDIFRTYAMIQSRIEANASEFEMTNSEEEKRDVLFDSIRKKF